MHRNLIVLMAEDNPGHRRLIQRNLGRSGLDCCFEVFDDGQEALDYFSRNTCSLSSNPEKQFVMLLDLRLPKVDGIQLLNFIKSDENLKNMPVIVLSTSDNIEDIEKCYEMGCSAFVTKPLEYEDFLTTVEAIGRMISTANLPQLLKKDIKHGGADEPRCCNYNS